MLNRKELKDLISHKMSLEAKTLFPEDYSNQDSQNSLGTCSRDSLDNIGPDCLHEPPVTNQQTFAASKKAYLEWLGRQWSHDTDCLHVLPVTNQQTFAASKNAYMEWLGRQWSHDTVGTSSKEALTETREEQASVVNPNYSPLDTDFTFDSGDPYTGNAGNESPSQLQESENIPEHCKKTVKQSGDYQPNTQVNDLCLKDSADSQPLEDSGAGRAENSSMDFKQVRSDLKLQFTCETEGTSRAHSSPGDKSAVPLQQFRGESVDQGRSVTGSVAPTEQVSRSLHESASVARPSGEPTFAPRELSLDPRRSLRVDEEKNSEATSEADYRKELAKRALKLLKRYVVPAVLVLVAIVILYPANPKPYSVETRLLFISRDGKTPEHLAWSLEKEAKYFNNTNILYASAQQLFSGRQDASDSSVIRNAQIPVPTGDGRDKFETSGEFIKWFLKSSSLDADYSALPARLTLKITGQDPNFLKAVSETYVRSYVDYRRSLERQNTRESKNELLVREQSSQPDSLKGINDRLQKVEFQENEYELALKLIDSGKSPFSGFLSKENMVEPSALTHFQQKIVQLELNKSSLKLRFSPDSREVRSMDQETQSVRKAMRQWVAEQLRFIKQNKEMLIAQKSDIEKSIAKPIVPKTSQKDLGAVLAKPVSKDAPIFLGDGLYLLWDSSSVVDKPTFAKAWDYMGSTVTGVQQSIGRIRDGKDALITGLYNSLVSDSAKKTDNVKTAHTESRQAEKGTAKKGSDNR
jgi:hypothetical protein